jgi:hypothetical protein
MSATSRAKSDPILAQPSGELRTLTPAAPCQNGPSTARVPALRCTPLLRPEQPRRFVRVPTHAFGVHPEHREYPRATLKLPLRLRRVDSTLEDAPITLVTRDISSTGIYFLCPKELALGAALELEIVLVSRPLGRGNVVAATMAHVCRIEPAAMPGWYGVAVSFDDMEFDRDDGMPSRFAVL